MRLGGSLAAQSRIIARSIGNLRSYRLPAGTYPNADPRSIYDSRVQCELAYTRFVEFPDINRPVAA